MAAISIPTNKRIVIEKWCQKNISPQLYYIHNKQGGRGWQIKDNRLLIDDDKKAIMLILGCL